MSVDVEQLAMAILERRHPVVQLQKRTRDADRRACAYHEAGHAVIATVLGAILGNVGLGRNGGGVADIAVDTPASSQQLRDAIAALVAGTIAEARFAGGIGAVPDVDLKSAIFLAMQIVASEKRDWLFAQGFVETANGLEGDVRVLTPSLLQIIRDETRRASELLLEHDDAVRAVAIRLVSCRTLRSDQVRTLVAPHLS